MGFAESTSVLRITAIACCLIELRARVEALEKK